MFPIKMCDSLLWEQTRDPPHRKLKHTQRDTDTDNWVIKWLIDSGKPNATYILYDAIVLVLIKIVHPHTSLFLFYYSQNYFYLY